MSLLDVRFAKMPEEKLKRKPCGLARGEADSGCISYSHCH